MILKEEIVIFPLFNFISSIDFSLLRLRQREEARLRLQRSDKE